MLSIVDIDLAGRIGKLKLKRGIVETPAFFPVIDPARQELSVEDIKNAGFNQVITNAYLLLKKFGEEAIKRGGSRDPGFRRYCNDRFWGLSDTRVWRYRVRARGYNRVSEGYR
jgi:hypothetical protein